LHISTDAGITAGTGAEIFLISWAFLLSSYSFFDVSAVFSVFLSEPKP